MDLLQTFYQQKISTLTKSEDDTARNAVLSLQSIVAHCQISVRERLQRFVAQGGFRDVASISQGGASPGSVDPDSRSEDDVVVNIWYCG